MVYRWQALSLMLWCCSCIHSKSTPKVLNGVPGFGVFPPTVGLALGTAHANSFVAGQCTGTFIRSDMVLTAGHCFVNHGFDTAMVFDFYETSSDHQSQRFSFNEQSFTVAAAVTYDQLIAQVQLPHSSRVYIHPAYLLDHGAYWADVALIEFAKDTVKPSKIAAIAKAAARVGEKVSVVGFGLTDDGDPQSVVGIRNYGTNTVVATRLDTWGSWNSFKLDPVKGASMIRLDGTRWGNRSAEGGQAVGDSGDSGSALYNAAGEVLGTDDLGGTLFPGVDYSALYVNIVGQEEVSGFIQKVLRGAVKPTSSGPAQ